MTHLPTPTVVPAPQATAPAGPVAADAAGGVGSRRQVLIRGLAGLAGAGAGRWAPASEAAGTARPASVPADEATPALSGLAEDLSLLKQALQTLHPGLLRYQSMADFEARFSALQAAWHGPARTRIADGPQATGERFLALARTLATLRCGHTYPNFFNQSRAVRDSVVLGAPRLPLDLQWLGTRLAVTGDPLGRSGLPRGTEVLAIDGVPAAQVLARLAPCVRADGRNEGMRAALLSTGSDEIETFEVFHPLVFGPRTQWTLQVRRPDGRVGDVTVDSAGASELVAARRAAGSASSASATGTPPSEPAPLWQMDWRDDGTAVLRMPGWAVYNTRWDWQAWLARVFERLAGEQRRGLVIDLRGNEGGLDCGDAILARLIDRPLPDLGLRRRVRRVRVPADLNPFLDTWDPGFRDWGDRVVPDGPGWWRFRDDGQRRIEPQGPRYRGRVQVLVDASNHSATLRFAALLQQHRLGTLVGQRTGGSQRGINGGAFFFMRLPASGLEVDLPLIGSFAPGTRPPTGLAPDVPVPLAPADLAEGRDPVRARALALARG